MLLSPLAGNLWSLSYFDFILVAIFGYIPNSLPEVQFLVPDWGEEAGFGVGLSYRPTSLCIAWYDNLTP